MDSYNIIKKSIKVKDIEFHVLTKILQNNNIIHHTKIFLKLYNKKKYNPRIFLSSFIVFVFPEIVLNNKDSKIDADLLQKASKLINNFLEFNDNLEDSIDKYINYFLFWKKIDQKIIAENMAENLLMLDKLKKDIKGKNNLVYNLDNEINTMENKIKDNCKFILNDKDINNYKDLENIFWNRYKNDLLNNPPNHEITLYLLNEIIIILKEITPNKLKEKYFIEYDDILDINFIKQKIDKNILDSNQIKELFIYIINKLREFQAANDDKQLNIWENNIKKIFNNNYKLSDLLPNILKIILEKFNKIKNIKLIFYDILNK